MSPAPLQAWNLVFEVDGGVSTNQQHPRNRTQPLPTTRPQGWFGTPGPAIGWERWPRNTVTGRPMCHALTLWLPDGYRRQGEQYPGIAYFASCGELGPCNPLAVPDADSDDPFLRDLALATDHPMLRRRKDILDGEHALIWLTADELSPGPRDPHPDTRRPGEHADYDMTINAWDDKLDLGRIWLVPRDDPNAGLVPRGTLFAGEEVNADGYVNPYKNSELLPWAKPLHLVSHLGGTPFPVNDLPEGLTPWYLELEEIGHLNYGGGNMQMDLESHTFDWSC